MALIATGHEIACLLPAAPNVSQVVNLSRRPDEAIFTNAARPLADNLPSQAIPPYNTSGFTHFKVSELLRHLV